MQSLIATVKFAEPLLAVISGFGYTSEYQAFATPEPVEQFEFVELLLVEEVVVYVEVSIGARVGIGGKVGKGVGAESSNELEEL